MKFLIWNNPASREAAVGRASARIKDIATGDAGLGAVLTENESMSEAHAKESMELVAVWRSLNLDDNATVDEYRRREYVQELRRRRIHANPALAGAMSTLRGSLLQAEPLIRELAEPQSSEESAISLCMWKVSIDDQTMNVTSQVQTLRATARQLMEELRQLIKGPVAHILTEPELRALRDAAWRR